jgi:hypothetical protein
MTRDALIVRNLAERYAALAAKPEQEEKRRAWSAHHALKPTRPLVLATYGMWNVWCCDVFGDPAMTCTDPFYRNYERLFKMAIFQDEVGDDSILEPWVTLRASVKGTWGSLWGFKEAFSDVTEKGGSKAFRPPIKDWSDAALTATPHVVDEEETQRNLEKLAAAVDGLLPIDVNRDPAYSGFMADISTSLIRLRGLNEIMLDMYEHPEELHRVLAFMRDGILANNAAAEAAGHYSLTSAHNQQPPYADGLPARRPNSGPVKRKDLWSFCAAQEYTLVSPAFHEEFLYQYQRPIQEQFGLVHYGCCEDLTRKIDMLRRLKNLRSIAVAPLADVHACAEQIGTDYVASWRPNPTDMVCAGWDEARIRRIVAEAGAAFRGGFMHVHLKDVETVQGDPSRLPRWVRIVRDTLA